VGAKAMPRFSCLQCFRKPGGDNELREAKEVAPPKSEGDKALPGVPDAVLDEKKPPSLPTATDGPANRPLDASRVDSDSRSVPVQHEWTAEDFIEEEIKDLCSTIAKTANKLDSEPHLTPAERTGLYDELTDSTARLKVGTCWQHTLSAGIGPPLMQCRLCRRSMLASTHRTRRRSRAQSHRRRRYVTIRTATLTVSARLFVHASESRSGRSCASKKGPSLLSISGEV
jgi:hypothetical protein